MADAGQSPGEVLRAAPVDPLPPLGLSSALRPHRCETKTGSASLGYPPSSARRGDASHNAFLAAKSVESPMTAFRRPRPKSAGPLPASKVGRIYGLELLRFRTANGLTSQSDESRRPARVVAQVKGFVRELIRLQDFRKCRAQLDRKRRRSWRWCSHRPDRAS